MNAIGAMKRIVSSALPVSLAGSAGALPPAEIAALSHQRIEGRLIREVEEMILFAMASGTSVPPKIGSILGRAFPSGSPSPGADWIGVPLLGGEATPSGTELGADATASGRGAVGPQPAPDYLSLLAAAHLELSRLVAPAKPATLVLLADDRRHHPFRNSFGAVPMARTMLVIAVLSLAVLLGIALSHQVTAANLTRGLLNLEGMPLLVNEVFLLAAAGVGASLANLKYLDRYISNCTYSRRYDGSYWTRLVMGLISGVVLSQMVYGALIASNVAPAAGSDANNILTTLGQPVLALLGGFSAELVHDVLAHFITAIGYLLGGGTKKQQASEQSPERRPRTGKGQH
jgi:hypothetical protein